MGGVCTGGIVKRNLEHGEDNKTSGFSGKLKTIKSFGKHKENSQPHAIGKYSGNSSYDYDSGELRFSFSSELKQSTPAKTVATKGTQKRSFLGKAGFVGLEVLDTLGSSVSNLNHSGFISGVASRGNRVSILAFEVANTIVKGANLLQSVSEENIQLLKKDILHLEGVQKLVSTDMDELLSIAASDKREELDVFSREVVRFGNLCKDPQWHSLDRFFSSLDLDNLSYQQLKSETELTMKELTTLAQHTSELYHELNALDRFEQDYRRKLEEVEALNLPRTGESLTILQSELKQQRKLVRGLKKKSLWSRSMEEIVEKLVDVITYIHQAILEAFGKNGKMLVTVEHKKDTQRLGIAGLALHYANVINQIDNIASRPTSLPPNTRDTLYQGLPNSVKLALRSRLQTLDAKEELSVSQVKAEMEKTLQWLVPVSANTNKAHQGFGWVGEWANSGPEFGKNTNTQTNLIRLQTLYHADKQKTDLYILELVTRLNQLISLVRQRDHGFKPPPVRSPMRKGLEIHSKMQRFLSMNHSTKTQRGQLSQEDRNLLDMVTRRRVVQGISKSQEFTVTKKRGIRGSVLSRSTGSSPATGVSTRSNTNVLDVMDGLDDVF